MTDHTNLIARLDPFVQGLGKAILREVESELEALQSQLDIQAGSIEAVQSANQRLAAERDQLRAEVTRLTPLQFRKAPCYKFC